ncbi:MAG: GntR family transcriptional regulator [Planctomycetia bacterium]|nr:GntR family transcriptional regulator [Planctomycetia bacterium]
MGGSRKQTREVVYDYIFKRILDGSLRFGSRLTELGVASELGVSRTPVHDALAKLVNKGIAVYTPSGGIHLKELTRTDIKELVALRRLYETYAAGIAAESASPYFIGKMKEACAILRQLALDIRSNKITSLNERWRIKNDAEIMFHLSIIQSTKNSRLIRVFSDAVLFTQILCTIDVNDRTTSLHMVADIYLNHMRLCRLIERRERDKAVAFMGKHLDVGFQTLLDDYDRRHPGEEEETSPLAQYEFLL